MPVLRVARVPAFKVYCESKGCRYGSNTKPSREEAIKEAAFFGWLRVGGKFYCPECRGQHAKQDPGSFAGKGVAAGPQSGEP